MRVRARTLLAKLSRSKSRSRVDVWPARACVLRVLYGIITPDGLPVCRYLLRGFLDVRCSPPHAC